MKIIASVNHKGGVGKTTLAVTLASYLANKGHSTILIDLDGQGNAAQFLGLDPEPGLLPFLYPDTPGRVYRSANRDNLWIVSNTKEANTSIERQTPAPEILSKALERLARVSPVDFVILDSAPSVGMLHTAPLLACDHYLVPIKLDQASMVGARSVTESTASLDNAVEIQGKFLGFVPNFWDRRVNESNQWLSFLYDLDKALVFPPIPVDARLPVSMAMGQTIWEFAPNARCIHGAPVHDGIKVGGFLRAFARLEKALKK